MVEAIANSIEDRLIDGLSFKLNPGASYVTDRRSVTFHPQGSNIYKPTSGTKMIRFNLTGDSWLDPSTFRFAFTLHNDDQGSATYPKTLRPLGSPWAFFRRLRILAGGQIIEDIDQYNRVHEMMHLLTAADSRENDGAEAFGYGEPTERFDPSSVDLPQIEDRQVFLFKPLSGLLGQNKFLPIRYMPLAIELELVDSMTDPIISSADSGAVATSTTFSSYVWSIINCEIKADLCTLDNALDNSYAQHLLSGKSLPINYSTWTSSMQTMTPPKTAVNVSRALTRLKSVFVTFNRDETTFNSNRQQWPMKLWKDFFSPMYDENHKDTTKIFRHSSEGEFEFQLQIGSKLYPEYPIRSHSEAFYQLRKCLGVQSSSVHSFDISAQRYRDDKFIIGIDTEKVLEAGWTGLNTRAGDLMRIRFDQATTETNRYPNRMRIVLESDQILEIRDTGVQVFD